MDFGRQPEPVKVVLTGHTMDVITYAQKIARLLEGQGDDTQLGAGHSKAGEPSTKELTIFPRAVND